MNTPLSTEQLISLQNNGFLILENMLNREEVDHLLRSVDEVIQTHEKESIKNNTRSVHGNEYYNIHNPLQYTDAFDFLVDHPKTFDVVTHLMGPFIEAMSLHVFVRHPSNAKTSNIGKFHTDSGPALQQILPTPGNLPLQLKFQYFLTDVLAENASNFIVIPGSHLKRCQQYNPYCLLPECNEYLERGEMPPGAIQLKLKAGDVLIHTLTLWHAVAPNHSLHTRRSISVRYGQMWFKNYYANFTKEVLERMTPRQRRLLGDYGENPRGDVAYRPPEDQLELILGERGKNFQWKHSSL